MTQGIDWEAYSKLQAQLENRDQVDSYTWGLETALEACLGSQNPQTAHAAGSRRERRHNALLRARALPTSHTVDPQDRLTAQMVLSTLPSDHLHLAKLLTLGYSYDEMSSQCGSTSSSLRKRVSRLRALASAA